MQPFELPEFYLPQPARLNPNVNRAREHTKEWAGQLGMLDPTGTPWDERRFDTMDYALLSSYTHPDAPGPELDLLTDWYVWVFYFDDDFLERYKRTGDLAGPGRYLDGLAAFMPMDLETAAPQPTNPVEVGLADLWFRTVLTNIIQKRVPDPVDYVEMRRTDASFSPTLARYALGQRIPEELLDSPPMRALADTFCDIGPLRPDIFRYDKEIGRERGITTACWSCSGSSAAPWTRRSR